MTTVHPTDHPPTDGPPPTDAPPADQAPPDGDVPPTEGQTPPDGPPPEVPAPSGRQPARPRPVFLLVGVVVAVALAIGLFTGIGTGGGGGKPVAGGQVPTFSLPRLGGGGTVGVAGDGGGNGTPAILVFFASWCEPCQAEIPMIAATHRQQVAAHSPLAKVAIIGVDGSDPTANAQAFVRRSGVTFPVGADRNYTVTQGKFYFTGLPAVVYVNGNGVIAALHEGPIESRAQLVAWQSRLLHGG